MVRACCIPGCLSGQNVPSHMFPKDIERHKQWFKELNMKVIEDEKELKKLRICYQHFRNEDYTNSPTRRTLERNAIPSINVLQHADGMNVEHIPQHTDGMNVEHIPQYTDGMNVEHILNGKLQEDYENNYMYNEAKKMSKKYSKLDTRTKRCKRDPRGEETQTVIKETTSVE
ncbi:hypothetical protein ALC57_11039 [Trachymyrmex cornetzi]|uniref:THAP-type domain-containing protein n=1 Tax=Trachymyrmex cornetzi TaxID=471704 RepID=A0A151J313_9HYME|nr:hypothetical protein ALC57_16094 [Trachymyrmex cornetzi]KYN16721.1 hypothetical protein ALC57_11039 [Trachymyrmex cornetzi]